MILSSADTIEGREIAQTIGIVRGNAARARGLGYDITAGVRNIFGGAVPEYSQPTSMIAMGVSEILAYGTAVKLR